jgi:branched-chain amino acid transport system ATP-binding protein
VGLKLAGRNIKGEIVAVIGPNGAGKSTRFKLISSFVAPTSGKVLYGGQTITGLPPHEVARRGVVRTFQETTIFKEMTALQNVIVAHQLLCRASSLGIYFGSPKARADEALNFGLKIAEGAPAEIQRSDVVIEAHLGRADDELGGAYLRRDKKGIEQDLQKSFARFPRLKERLRQQAGSLSGGEQQMVVVSRALMARPRLLLLDEPSLGLAPIVVRDIARAIVEINREEGISVILVEQNSRMALKISNRAYALETGRIALTGRSSNLLNDDHIRRLYLGLARS